MKSRILSAVLVRKVFNDLYRQYGITTKIPAFIPQKRIREQSLQPRLI
jgi:hypothetical protein